MIHSEPWFSHIAGRDQDIAALARDLKEDPYNPEPMAQLLMLLHRHGMLQDWLHKHLFATLEDPHFDEFKGLWKFVNDAPTSALPKDVWAEMYRMYHTHRDPFWLGAAWRLWYKRGLKDVLGGYFPDFTWRELKLGGETEIPDKYVMIGVEVTSSSSQGETKRTVELRVANLVRSLMSRDWEFRHGEFVKTETGDVGDTRARILTVEALPQILRWIAEARRS